MATHVEYQHRRATPQEELAAAPHDEATAQAMLDGLQLLRSLHHHGVLDTANKLVRGGAGLTTGALHVLEGDSSTHLIRNLLEVARLLTALDPVATGTLGRALNAGVTEGSRRVARGEGVGLPELLGLLRDKDVQIALGALFGTLKGFGGALRAAQEEAEHPTHATTRQGANR